MPENQRERRLRPRRALRALIVENEPADVELCVHELKKAGFDVTADVVETPEAFAERLATQPYEVILADYNLPQWSGLDALAELRRQRKDIPFILVTGSLGEEAAAECIKKGAADYVLKDRPARLALAIRRALRESAQQKQRRRMEAALRESEERFSKAFRCSPDAITITTLEEGHYLEVNDGFLRLTGYEREEVIGHTAAELKVWADPAARPQLLRELRERGAVHDREFPFRVKSGEVRTFLVSADIIEIGTEECLLAVSRDITERQRAEEALASSEARYRGLFEDSPVSLWEEDFSTVKTFLDSLRAQGITDFDTYFQEHPEAVARCAEGVKVVDVNRAALELFEASSKGALRGSLAAVFTQESLSTFRQELVALAAGQPGVETETVARTLTSKVRNLAVRWTLAPGCEDTFDRVLVSVLDITERKTLEEQLRQAQKMEAVGRLAGGIAHDFNNLLNVVLGYSEMLAGRLGSDLKLQDMVSEIRKAAERATSLTRQLLAFSRKQVLQPQVLNLNDVVADTEKMLQRLIGEDIELVSKLHAALGNVKADPGQIEQVIMNLAVNARDAMPAGGKLTIETANVDLDDAYARNHATAQPGSFVLLAVSDTGCGMDEITRAHIFEPFFTTKQENKGTGLGLATVYGIVKQSGGWVWVYSEPGHGSTFKIYLPRVQAAAEALPECEPPLCGVLTDTGEKKTVLLAEDEQALRQLIRHFLQELGYTVLESTTIAEAVQLAEQHPDPIHLLLTDVVMPGSSGRALADRVLALRPDIKVLYMSGYPDETIVHHGVLAPGVDFLQKPFTVDALARKLRAVLNHPRPASGRA